MIKVVNTTLSNLSDLRLHHGNCARVPEILARSLRSDSPRIVADRHLYFIMLHGSSEARASIDEARRITEKRIIIYMLWKIT